MAELAIEEQRRGVILHGERIPVEALIGEAAVVERQGAQLSGHGIDAERGGIIINGKLMLVEPLIGQPAVQQGVGQNLRVERAGFDGLGVIGHRRFDVTGLQGLVGLGNQSIFG